MSAPNILIVEDEVIIAADLEHKLQQLGYRVAASTDRGDEAVALARQLRPDLVLMDICLPGKMDGIMAAEVIRDECDLPVIFVTAHSDAATVERAKLAEPFGYIVKPFDDREIRTLIEVTLYKHQADRKVREQREWLRVTLTSIGDAVITCDTESRITFFNPAAEKVSGWTAFEVMGQPMQTVVRLINEPTGQPGDDPIARVLREGRPVALANHTALIAKDGHAVPIEDSAAPILDAAGRVIGAVFVFHDVTEERLAQREILRAKEEWERTFDSVPDLIAILDTQNRIVRANQAMARRLGMTPAQCVGQRCCACVHGTRNPPGYCPQIQTLRDCQEHVVEVHEERLGGDFLITTTPLRDEHGAVIGTVHVARDITERKRAEQSVRASLNRYRSFMEVTGQLGWTTNAAGEAVEAMPAWQKFTGQSEEESRGWGWSKALHPDDLPQAVEAWNQAVQSKSTYEAEYRVRRHDGIYRDFMARSVPVLNEDGSVREWVGTCIDITERKQTEDVVRFLANRGGTDSGEDFFQALTRHLAQSLGMEFVCIDRLEPGLLTARTLAVFSDGKFENNITYTLKDTPCGDVVGRKICCFPRDVCRLFPNDAMLQEMRAESYLGATLWNSEGKPIGLIAVIGRRPLADSRVAESILQLVAVRAAAELERRQAELALARSADELARSNIELEQYAYVASHDLQEPLRAVSGYLALIEERLGDKLDEKGRHQIAGALDGAARMKALIGDLLELSRVGTRGQAFAPVDLNTALDHALVNLSVRMREAGAVITRDPLPTLRADAVQIEQLLQNLIGNAVKFRGDAAPQIHVSARRGEGPGEEVRTQKSEVRSPEAEGIAGKVGTHGPGWILSVRDNGIGIDPQYFERIFLIFQRLHTRKQYPGTGMGLAICKKIVARHSGRIWVESQPGQGSTFHFSLPERTTP